MLRVMAFILSAATWLNDEGDENGVAIAGETHGALAAFPIHARPGSAPASRLSPREREVAALVAGGCTNREIAAALFISAATAERDASTIFDKLGVRSRTRVAVWVVESGLAFERAS